MDPQRHIPHFALWERYRGGPHSARPPQMRSAERGAVRRLGPAGMTDVFDFEKIGNIRSGPRRRNAHGGAAAYTIGAFSRTLRLKRTAAPLYAYPAVNSGSLREGAGTEGDWGSRFPQSLQKHCANDSFRHGFAAPPSSERKALSRSLTLSPCPAGSCSPPSMHPSQQPSAPPPRSRAAARRPCCR